MVCATHKGALLPLCACFSWLFFIQSDLNNPPPSVPGQLWADYEKADYVVRGGGGWSGWWTYKKAGVPRGGLGGSDCTCIRGFIINHISPLVTVWSPFVMAKLRFFLGGIFNPGMHIREYPIGVMPPCYTWIELTYTEMFPSIVCIGLQLH